MDEARALSSLHKKREVARSSVTRLGNRLRELESDPKAADVLDCAKQLLLKLDEADSDFKSLHFQVLDLIDENDDEALKKEQDILDQHEGKCFRTHFMYSKDNYAHTHSTCTHTSS